MLSHSIVSVCANHISGFLKLSIQKIQYNQPWCQLCAREWSWGCSVRALQHRDWKSQFESVQRPTEPNKRGSTGQSPNQDRRQEFLVSVTFLPLLRCDCGRDRHFWAEKRPEWVRHWNQCRYIYILIRMKKWDPYTRVGNGSKLRQMGSVQALRLRDKSFLNTSGLASIKIPLQLNLRSKSSVFDKNSPFWAPQSTKNPLV